MMEENNQIRREPNYPVFQFNQEFYKEIPAMKFGNDKSGRVIATKYPLWEYIPTTTMRLYFANKKTQIFRLVETKWQCYLNEGLFYPGSSFRHYLLTEDWGGEFFEDTVDDEIIVWLEIRDKIYQ